VPTVSLVQIGSKAVSINQRVTCNSRYLFALTFFVFFFSSLPLLALSKPFTFSNRKKISESNSHFLLLLFKDFALFHHFGLVSIHLIIDRISDSKAPNNLPLDFYQTGLFAPFSLWKWRLNHALIRLTDYEIITNKSQLFRKLFDLKQSAVAQLQLSDFECERD
jgi:hypothetical protein